MKTKGKFFVVSLKEPDRHTQISGCESTPEIRRCGSRASLKINIVAHVRKVSTTGPRFKRATSELLHTALFILSLQQVFIINPPFPRFPTPAIQQRIFKLFDLTLV